MVDTYSVTAGFVRNVLLPSFFRSIEIVGKEHVPPSGGTIFVSNHPNQFLDAANILAAVDQRRVRFLTAAKSMRRRIIGDLAHALGSIPVERAQDLASRGRGEIRVQQGEQEAKVEGVGVDFVEDKLVAGCKLKLEGEEGEVTITKVLSSTEAVGVPSHDFSAFSSKKPFKIFPKLDQSEVYSQVYHALNNGDCIGIFPEGGSHDRVGQLLELKAGVAVIALGALSKFPNLDLKIVPIGLNYFEPYKFRSSLILEFGQGFSVEKSLVEKYSQGGPDKREAIGLLLAQIERAMLSTIIPTPNFDVHRAVHTARALYVPSVLDVSLSAGQRHEINKRISAMVTAFGETEEGKRMLEELKRWEGGEGEKKKWSLEKVGRRSS